MSWHGLPDTAEGVRELLRSIDWVLQHAEVHERQMAKILSKGRVWRTLVIYFVAFALNLWLGVDNLVAYLSMPDATGWRSCLHLGAACLNLAGCLVMTWANWDWLWCAHKWLLVKSDVWHFKQRRFVLRRMLKELERGEG